jgi:uncharacterized cupredoxin-like copper-binding protein
MMKFEFSQTKKTLLGALGLALVIVALVTTGGAARADTSPVANAGPQPAAAIPAQQSGCSGTPIISSFSASPTSIEPGQTATLSWGLVSNAEAAMLIAPGHVTGVGTPGQMTVQPDRTTTYVLQGVCGGVTSQALVTVNVGVPACGGGAPTITSFTANPPAIQPGQTATLSWGLVQNAEAAVLVTPQGKQGVGTPGQVVVQPGQTTTYTLVGYCGNDVVGQSVTVTVAGEQGCSGTPSIQYFVANPPVIQRGGSTTLQWGSVTNASGAYLETPEGIQGVATPGQMTVQPSGTSTYSLYGLCGSRVIQASATVYVQ